MNNIRDKFEAWNTPKPESFYADKNTYDLMLDAWQAATEQSQKEIEALKAREKALVEALEACKYDCNTGEIIGIARDALATVRGE